MPFVEISNEDFKILKSRLNTHLVRKSPHFARRKNHCVVNRVKTTTFGEKSLRTLEPKVWNSLPEDVKGLTSLLKFKEFIKTFHGPEWRSSNTWVTHITILELHSLACIYLIENLLPKINKQNIKLNKTVVF